jgi:DNA invertase Pin-like site-specific DNA recombinase
VNELAAEGVQFHRLPDGIAPTTPHGRFGFHLMASLAPMERERIGERTQAGLEAARKRGRVVGRKRRMTPSKIASAPQRLRGGMPPREVAHNLGGSIPTLYRWVPASSRSEHGRLRVLGRERRKREHALPRFPFHCYTNPLTRFMPITWKPSIRR